MTPDTISINTIVLVVDDSPESLGMLNIALGQAGYTVLVALSGAQSKSILERIVPDIILMDAIMPEMDGFETCISIKQTHPDIPIIFMTGLTDEEHILAGFTAGGVDYIVKPINPSEVIARLKVHIKNSRLKESAHKALDTIGKHIFEVDNEGKVIWATHQAKKLVDQVEELNSTNTDDFQSQLKQWLQQDSECQELTISAGDKKIHLRYISAHNTHHHLIQLSEITSNDHAARLMEVLSITHREAEVLLWLPHGKSNKDISKLLDISPHTVNKHMELIFRKLDVNNRTAAAGLCLKVINDDP